jgi:hypothetical protein
MFADFNKKTLSLEGKVKGPNLSRHPDKYRRPELGA